MRALEDSEKSDYSFFMDEVCSAVLVSSYNSVKELSDKDQNPLDAANEIAVAMGQVVLDKIIELTTHMNRDKLIRYLAEIAISYAVIAMQQSPEYKMSLIVKNKIL